MEKYWLVYLTSSFIGGLDENRNINCYKTLHNTFVYKGIFFNQNEIIKSTTESIKKSINVEATNNKNDVVLQIINSITVGITGFIEITEEQAKLFNENPDLFFEKVSYQDNQILEWDKIENEDWYDYQIEEE